MKLYTIFYDYNGYGESDVFASETGSTTDAIKYLKNTNQITEAGDLANCQTYLLTFVTTSDGDPYKVGIL